MNWQERAEKAEDVLRSLASFVGAGGYNADKVDVDMFEQKIRWGIGQIMERLEKAESELASLRWQEPVATLLLSYDGADFEMYYDNNKLRFEGMSMKLYAAAGAAPAVPENFHAAAVAYLESIDRFNTLNGTVGGGWSTKKAGTHQEIVLAANEMHGRRMLLESLLQSISQSEVRHD